MLYISLVYFLFAGFEKKWLVEVNCHTIYTVSHLIYSADYAGSLEKDRIERTAVVKVRNAKAYDYLLTLLRTSVVRIT